MRREHEAAVIRRGSLLEARRAREEKLRKALQLLREALEGDTVQELDRLFRVEEILAGELGNPVWESPEKRARRRCQGRPTW